jgi:hypothetical protein
MKSAVIGIILVILFFIGGFFAGYYYNKPRTTIIAQPIISNTVKRPVASMSAEELRPIVLCYDTAEPRLDITIDGRDITASAGLCEREWSRTAQVEVSESGNWKLYVGIGAGAVATGAVCYFIFK